MVQWRRLEVPNIALESGKPSYDRSAGVAVSWSVMGRRAVSWSVMLRHEVLWGVMECPGCPVSWRQVGPGEGARHPAGPQAEQPRRGGRQGGAGGPGAPPGGGWQFGILWQGLVCYTATYLKHLPPQAGGDLATSAPHHRSISSKILEVNPVIHLCIAHTHTHTGEGEAARHEEAGAGAPGQDGGWPVPPRLSQVCWRWGWR